MLPDELRAALLMLLVSDGEPVGPHMKRVTDNEYHFTPEFFIWAQSYSPADDALPSDISDYPERGNW